MRECFYIPTGTTAIEGIFDIIGENVVSQEKAVVVVKEDDPVPHDNMEDPQTWREDRNEEDLHSATIVKGEKDNGYVSTSFREDMYDEHCLERVPSTDALALSCLLFTKEERIKELEAELVRLRNEWDVEHSSGFLFDSATKLEETVDAWNRELLSTQGLELVMEAEIATRDTAIQRLTEDLTRATRRVSELEVLLEFHDFKFAWYEDHCSSSDQGKSTRNGGPHSENEKLVGDLEEIEKLYISAKQGFTEKADQLQQECNMYKARHTSLENSRRRTGSPSMVASFDGDDRDDIDVPRTFMQKKIQILETDLNAQNELTSNLQTQVDELTTSLRNKEKKHKQEIQALKRTEASLESKVLTLQSELQSASAGVTVYTAFEPLESNMEGLLAEIARLEARLRTKERIIFKLQEKMSTKRQRGSAPSMGEEEQPQQSPFVEKAPIEVNLLEAEPNPVNSAEKVQRVTEEIPVETNVVEEVPAESNLVEEVPVEEVPIEEVPVEEFPTEGVSVEEQAPIVPTPPVKERPVKETVVVKDIPNPSITKPERSILVFDRLPHKFIEQRQADNARVASDLFSVEDEPSI